MSQKYILTPREIQIKDIFYNYNRRNYLGLNDSSYDHIYDWQSKAQKLQNRRWHKIRQLS